MVLFSPQLNKVETRLLENLSNTKKLFPEETNLIEYGLSLMWGLVSVVNAAKKDLETKPNVYANTNLFGRNRELLLNAYFCMLTSNYGTQSVILRTVLENNNLMRLFNQEPKNAYEWLPKEKQAKFEEEVQKKYSGSTEKKEFGASCVRNAIFDEKKAGVKQTIKDIYGSLCDYTHPNFLGWQEIMSSKGEDEVLLDLPTLTSYNAEESTKIMLYMIQLSFKTFFDTFKNYIAGYEDKLITWQNEFNRVFTRYIKG